MANVTTVQVTGLAELERRLTALSADMGGKIARGATAAGASVIRKEAKIRAPISDKPHQLGVRKDQIAQPGNLRKNIILRRNGKSELAAEYHVTWRAGKAIAGLDAFYGKFVELGTVKMAPRPFLRPAFDSKKIAAVDKIAEVLKKRLDKAGA